MARTQTFPLYDRIFDGQFAETLNRWRHDEGLSVQDIAFRLATEHDLKVSIATVHRWFRELDKPEDAA